MTDNLSHKMFTAKDIEKFFGINANTLFYWVQTRRLVTPAVVGQGRGKRNRFSMDELASLYLIKVLIESGFDIAFIESQLKRIVQPRTTRRVERFITIDELTGMIFPNKPTSSVVTFFGGGADVFPEFNIWEFYKDRRKESHEDGLLLFVTRTVFEKERYFMDCLTDMKGYQMLMEMFNKPSEKGIRVADGLVNYNAINIVTVINHVERVTGEKL